MYPEVSTSLFLCAAQQFATLGLASSASARTALKKPKWLGKHVVIHVTLTHTHTRVFSMYLYNYYEYVHACLSLYGRRQQTTLATYQPQPPPFTNSKKTRGVLGYCRLHCKQRLGSEQSILRKANYNTTSSKKTPSMHFSSTLSDSLGDI